MLQALRAVARGEGEEETVLVRSMKHDRGDAVIGPMAAVTLLQRLERAGLTERRGILVFTDRLADEGREIIARLRKGNR
jgi:hypothetical protein